MAIPTITSLSVTSGPTQGRTLVCITGTGFAEYPAPPATGVVPVPDPPVKILFGTEEATDVQSESATKVWCLTPIADPGTVSVTVTNLDSDGDPVAGETVIKAAAYTFIRPYIRVPTGAGSVDRYRGDLHRLTRQVVLEWQRQVLENVVLKKPNKDFADTPASGVVRLSKLPGVVLYGPRLSPNRFLTANGYEAHTVSTGVFHRRRRVEARDVAFSFTAVCEGLFEPLNLIEIIDRFFDRNTSIKLLKDPTDSSQGYAEYEMVYTDVASVGTEIDGDNQTVVEGGFFIRGFEMQSTAGFTNDGIEFIGDTVDEVVMTQEPYDEEEG